MEDNKMFIDDRLKEKSPEDLIKTFFEDLTSSQINNSDVLIPNETFLDKKNFNDKHPIRTQTIVIK